MQEIGRFQILDKLGAGNQGTVYLCHDPELRRQVAIKLMDTAIAGDSLLTADSLHEARVMSRIQHPNIVTIYEVGNYQGKAFLVCEYVQGELLSSLLKRRQLEVDLGLEIIQGILEGITRAHGLGIIHRDLKPANVMISDERVPKVMDFGISRELSPHMSNDAKLTGTPRYMAPEYIQRGEVSTRADVFALGAILIELLTGQPAFTGNNRQQVLQQIVHAQVTPPSKINSELDERLDGIALKAVSKEPSARYDSAGEMLAALKAYRDSYKRDAIEVGETKGTIEFLLRRMRHKSDFPALANSISALNRLVASEDESISVLASAVTKDFALTSKILRVVNSAYYQRFAGTIGTISRAIVVLGVNGVRSIAASLVFFEHLHDKSQAKELKEQIHAALFSAVLAGQASENLGFASVEESFLCAMMYNLGAILVTYYLREERHEIDRLVAQEGFDLQQAQKIVLGTDFQEIGIAVANQWNFPTHITRSMQELKPDAIKKPRSDEEKLRFIANFANDAANVLAKHGSNDEHAIDNLLGRYQKGLNLNKKSFGQLLSQSKKEYLHVTKDIADKSTQNEFINRLVSGQDKENVSDSTSPSAENGKSQHLSEQLGTTLEITTSLPQPDSESILTDGIQEVTNILLEQHTLTQVFNIILETMYRGMAFNRVVLCLHDVNTQQMVAKLGFGEDIKAFIERFRFPSKYSVDVFHAALKNGVDVYIEDASESKIKSDLPQWYKELSAVGSFVIFPLLVNRRAVGFIYADHPVARGLEMTPRQLNLLKALRNQAVLAFRERF